MSDLQLESVAAVVWTDDDGTTYRRVMTEDGIEDREVPA